MPHRLQLQPRQVLIKDRTAANNRSKIHGVALLKQQYAKRLKEIEKDIAAIEAAMMEITAGEAQLVQTRAGLKRVEP